INIYFCQKKNGLEIRILKMKESNVLEGNIKRFQFGGINNISSNGKLIFVGETGSGKTTLINAMVNNILDVNFTDNFRYSVCDLNNKPRSESESQTDFVTEYTFNYKYGMKRKCNFVLVDTPGFGDTRGPKIQKENVQQILKYISKESSKVGLVIQSSTNRLTAEIRSILLDMKTLAKTGQIESLIILSTFADSGSPIVEEILEGYDITYNKLYLFNNNALYSKTQGISDRDRNSFKRNWTITNRSIDMVLDFLRGD
ncbi:unnamed protein product, partial [Meganyctiphanes norvegica]